MRGRRRRGTVCRPRASRVARARGPLGTRTAGTARPASRGTCSPLQGCYPTQPTAGRNNTATLATRACGRGHERARARRAARRDTTAAPRHASRCGMACVRRNVHCASSLRGVHVVRLRCGLAPPVVHSNSARGTDHGSTLGGPQPTGQPPGSAALWQAHRASRESTLRARRTARRPSDDARLAQSSRAHSRRVAGAALRE
mmetsp:Transcript_52018/g.119679  ORF Transcript_52018/g.119679 Transcript_52018/m.119679 type:complete len:201 (-) Transcript_52018:863-1465(-)